MMQAVYKDLETPEGERQIYSIGKARDKSAKDFTQIRHIKSMERFYGNMLKSWTGRKVIMISC